MKTMEKLKKMIPILTVMALDFYVLPLLIQDTGSAILILLLVIPLVCLACSAVYGLRHSFHLEFPLLTALLFAPSVFLFYNSSAWVYIVGYGVTALAGNAIGALIYKCAK